MSRSGRIGQGLQGEVSPLLQPVKKPSVRAALVLLTGLLALLSFPDAQLAFLAWICLVPLLLTLTVRRFTSGFICGWVAGLIFTFGSMYWIIHVLVHYGRLPLVFSIPIFFLLSALLAMFWGVFGYLGSLFIQRGGLKGFLLLPPLWVALEYLRSIGSLAFPWNLFGYSQYQNTPLIQVASVSGVYGVSFLVVLVNALLASVIFSPRLRPRLLALGGALLCVVGPTLFGWLILAKDGRAPASQIALRCALIQPNIPQDQKWDSSFQGNILRTLERLTAEGAGRGARFVIWPESALPYALDEAREGTEWVIDLVSRHDISLHFGSIRLASDRIYNSAYTLNPASNLQTAYDKQILVPFGEYVPFKRVLTFAEKLVEEVGDLSAGSQIVLNKARGIPFSTAICYEIIFPWLIRGSTNAGAQFLVTITNDAWFGRSAAPHQHFAAAVFRAVENRRYVLRAANTGISGVVDSYGRILSRSDLFQEGVLLHEVLGRTELSVYTRFGDFFAWGCGGTVLLALASFGVPVFVQRWRREE